MARLKKNSLLNSLSGHIGKELVFKQYEDKVVISKYPDMSKVKPSEKQKRQRELIKQANMYARQACQNPELRSFYEKDTSSTKSIFNKAKKDFFNKLKNPLEFQ